MLKILIYEQILHYLKKRNLWILNLITSNTTVTHLYFIYLFYSCFVHRPPCIQNRFSSRTLLWLRRRFSYFTYLIDIKIISINLLEYTERCMFVLIRMDRQNRLHIWFAPVAIVCARVKNLPAFSPYDLR